MKEREVRQYLQASMTIGIIESVTFAEVVDQSSAMTITVLFRLIPGGEVFTLSQTFTGLATEESFA